MHGGKYYQKKGDGIVYKRLENNDEYDRIINCKEWKIIEKKPEKEPGISYEIKSYTRSKDEKRIQYYMVSKKENFGTKTVTTKMIYKKSFDKSK
ncbi:MAG: hypothetical protein HFH68_03440 [Lachnospiraceae bacterium]|nr:hypothetical protein [Lachnospiraceae bacterium]